MNNNKSRTRNVTINASIGLISQIIKILIDFILRTIFIKQLGSEYLGVNGLFTNILTILSFAELGIGNAIIFSMYKEIANNNTKKIKTLMLLYKKTYITIGTIILLVGLLITPFITYIINGVPNIKEDIYLLYILFLTNTAVSYFFAYKKAIISAHQKEYIINIYRLIIEIIRVTLQIIILILTKNFILYLIIQILCTLSDNIILSFKADKMFPYLKDKNVEKLEKTEQKKIFSNVKSLVMYKFGSIMLNGTDNIIISKMLGLVTVGIISNYNLLILTVTALVSSALNGFTASIGNLNTESNAKKQEKIFNQLFLISVWIYGFCSIAFISLSNDFITIWIGPNYKLSILPILAIGLHLYVNGVQFAGYTYRNTMGLFNKGKYCPIIAAFLNIILSIILCYKIGLTGILLATSISRLVTTTWYDIYMVYKHKLNKSPISFYIKYIRYFIITIIIGIINYKILTYINSSNIFYFMIKALVCTIIINTLFLLTFYKTSEYKELSKKIATILTRKLKK